MIDVESEPSLLSSEIGSVCQIGMVQKEKGRGKGEVTLVLLVCDSSFGGVT